MICPNCNSQLPEGARFCGVCGNALTAAPNGEPSTIPAAPPVSPQAPPRAPKKKQKSAGMPVSTRTLAIGGGILVVFICLIAAVMLAYNFLPRVLGFGSGNILYAIQDGGPTTAPNTLASVQPDGSNNQEIVRNRDGLRFVINPYAGGRYLSPDGRWFAVHELRGQSWELAVYSLQGSSPLLVDRLALPPDSDQISFGFSPDGRRFAYNSFDERRNELNLHVIDQNGQEIRLMPNLVFASFFPDNRRILAIQTDETDRLFADLVAVEVDSGSVQRITSLAENSGWVRPLISPDGANIYFYDDNELVVVAVGGGPTRRVYEFESWVSNISLSPDNKFVVIYDQLSGSDRVGELRLLNPADNRPARIDRDVNMRPRSTSPVASKTIDFSASGNLVAYLTDEPDNLSLYVTGVDGRDRKRISSGNMWMAFAFSPNGRQIAYIEGRGNAEPGRLFIADVDGSNRLQLDADVWSFQFAPDGRTLVYSKVTGFSRGRPESELYVIRPNGERQELILDAQRGVISLLAWTR